MSFKNHQSPSYNLPHDQQLPAYHLSRSCQFLPSVSEPSSPVTRKPNPNRQQEPTSMAILDSDLLQQNPTPLLTTSTPFHPLALRPTPSSQSPEDAYQSNEWQSKFYYPDTTGSFSTLRQRLTQSNQYITGLHSRYASKINNLQNLNKTYRMKLAECNQALQQAKSQNIKKGRELGHTKQRMQTLQNENNNLKIKIKQCQTQNRQLELALLRKTHELNTDTNQNQILKKRMESREKEHKAKIDDLNEQLIDLQRERENIWYQLNREREARQDDGKKWQEEMREQERSSNHQKEVLLKRIHKLENKLKEKSDKAVVLENGQKELQKSIELDRNNDQRMKSQVESLTYQVNLLKKSLSIAEASLQSTQKELKSLASQNEQIKHLKSKLIEKDELISILRNKIIELQGIIQHFQNRLTQQQQQIYTMVQEKMAMEQDKKDLKDQIENQKKSIAKLISQIQFLENTSELMNNQFIKKSTYIEKEKEELSVINQEIERSNEELQYKVKVMQQELAQEQKKSSHIEAVASELKQKNNDLVGEISKLNVERLSLSQNLAKLAVETSEMDQKKSMLQSQIVQLKTTKELKESIFSEKIGQLSKRQQAMAQEIQNLNQQIEHLLEKIEILNKENSDFYNESMEKDKELQQAQEQLFIMRQQKYKTQEKLEAFQCQSMSNQVKLHEYEQEIENLKKYIEDLQIHINELDNILVWNFEEGKGESNDFIQRKGKMEQIVQLLQQKMKQIEHLKAQGREKDEAIKERDSTIEDYKNLLAKFSDKLETFLEEKDNLTKMIEDIDISNKALTEKLTSYKEKEVEWMNKERALNRKLKWKEDEITAAGQQKAMIMAKREHLEALLQEKQSKIEQLSEDYASQREKSSSLKQMVDKLTSDRRKMEAETGKKVKELTRQIVALRRQNEEKGNHANQLESDKKQQVNQLTNQLNALRSEMRDFSTFYDSQKFNYMKRNLLLVDLGTTLAKFQKANSIKSHLTSPLKDIIRKMEQFDNNSSKIFAKYDKFEGK